MRNEEQSGRKQRGLLSITVGLLLIAAALFLASYNLYDELRAEQSARQAVTQLDAYLPAEAAPEAPSDSARDQEPLVSDERTVIPDYVLSPNMEMPVETINGIDFIGVLRIPALELELPVKMLDQQKITILYCRLSNEDAQDGESNSIANQELLCRGWFLPPNTYDCGSFVVNGTAVVGKEPKKAL